METVPLAADKLVEFFRLDIWMIESMEMFMFQNINNLQ